MLNVPIVVRASQYGYGAFAAADIPVGTVVWYVDGVADPTVLRFSSTAADAASSAGVPVRRWATQDPDGTWLLAVDGSQFFNHRPDDDPSADTATCAACGCVYATRDIPSGAELFCDYRVDDVGAVEKLGATLAAGRPKPGTAPCPHCNHGVPPATAPMLG